MKLHLQSWFIFLIAVVTASITSEMSRAEDWRVPGAQKRYLLGDGGSSTTSSSNSSGSAAPSGLSEKEILNQQKRQQHLAGARAENEKGEEAFNRGDYDAAVEHYYQGYRESLRGKDWSDNPTNQYANAFNRAGDMAANKGDYKAALDYFNRFIRLTAKVFWEPQSPFAKKKRQNVRDKINAIEAQFAAAKEGTKKSNQKFATAETGQTGSKGKDTAKQQLKDASLNGRIAVHEPSIEKMHDSASVVWDGGRGGKRNTEQDKFVATPTGRDFIPPSVRERPDFMKLDAKVRADQKEYNRLEAKLAASKEARDKAPSRKEFDALAVKEASIVNELSKAKSQIRVDEIKKDEIVSLAMESLDGETKGKSPKAKKKN